MACHLNDVVVVVHVTAAATALVVGGERWGVEGEAGQEAGAGRAGCGGWQAGGQQGVGVHAQGLAVRQGESQGQHACHARPKQEW